MSHSLLLINFLSQVSHPPPVIKSRKRRSGKRGPRHSRMGSGMKARKVKMTKSIFWTNVRSTVKHLKYKAQHDPEWKEYTGQIDFFSQKLLTNFPFCNQLVELVAECNSLVSASSKLNVIQFCSLMLQRAEYRQEQMATIIILILFHLEYYHYYPYTKFWFPLNDGLSALNIENVVNCLTRMYLCDEEFIYCLMILTSYLFVQPSISEFETALLENIDSQILRDSFLTISTQLHLDELILTARLKIEELYPLSTTTYGFRSGYHPAEMITW